LFSSPSIEYMLVHACTPAKHLSLAVIAETLCMKQICIATPAMQLVMATTNAQMLTMKKKQA